MFAWSQNAFLLCMQKLPVNILQKKIASQKESLHLAI